MLLGFCTAGLSIRTSENGPGRRQAALDRAVAGPARRVADAAGSMPR
jgi:hypothetical protein